MISMRTAFLALLVPLHLLFAAPATATDASNICAPADDPCLVKVVKGGVLVDPGSTLDFGSRTLRIPPGAQLVVTGSGEA